MRSTLEIIVAVKDSTPVTEEELRMALLALSGIEYFSASHVRRFAALKNADPLFEFLRAEAERWGTERFNALKKDPLEWLGPTNIPGSTEYKDRMALGKKIVKSATGLEL